MKAVRLHPGGRLLMHDEREPVAGPGDALLRVAAVGLCGSDRHWLLDGGIGDVRLDEPLVLGHEFSGFALTGLHVGRLVAADPTINCMRCAPCRSGRENLCREQRFAGYSGTDGALREMVAWPERLLHPLAEVVTPAEGTLAEPLAVAIHALELAGAISGRRVGVVGCGPIGLLVVSLAVAAGATVVVAAEPEPHRLAAALARGAQPVSAADLERGELEVVFEVAGEDAAVDTALSLAAPGAAILLVGIPTQDRTSFVASVARRKGLALQAVRRSTPQSFGRAVRLVEESRLDLPALVSHRLPLAQAEQAFSLLAARDGLKIVLELGGGPA